MQTSWHEFNSLSLDQLYQILRLRQQIFIIEQNSIYDDIDNKDQNAMHCLIEESNEIIAYSRLLKNDDIYIGRILVAKNHRNKKLGSIIMQEALARIKTHAPNKKVKLSAQYHLQGFYKKFGFKAAGNAYDDGGILHIDMVAEKLGI